ncbi:MAG: tetratricopeptide repeat protein, partial [Chloroflexi bacterium]|nr:tetratricopeptide repeat protein [Chloroflexota bacterium]
VLLIFVGTYALAWTNAKQLTERFVRDADASYNAGKFTDALVGYQQFDQPTNQYVNYGGYLAVEKIWSNAYSWPKPAAVAHAAARTQEIVNQRLTVQDAEQYIQANTGKPGAPYFGEIYLRLGELYEQAGQTADAKDVYESMPDLFPDRSDLIQQAQAHLARLNGQGK